MEIISHGLSVSRCNNCKGFLVEAEKVDHPHIPEFAEPEVSAGNVLEPKEEKIFICPYDGSKMDSTDCAPHTISIFFVCPTCRRAWFDARKLSKSINCRERRKNEKRSTSKHIGAALAIALLFFAGCFILRWLSGHFEAETLKVICIASIIVGTGCLFGLGLASQDTDSCGSGSCCVSRAAIAGAAGMLGDNFWKILTAFFALTAVIFFLAWAHHPEKAKNPLETFLKKKYVKSQGSARPMMIDDLRDMGDAKRFRKEFAEAEVFYKKALALYERLPRENAHSIAITLHSMGLLYRETGQFQEAESCYKRALTLFEKLSDEKNSKYKPIVMVALTLKDMAVLYRDVGRRKEADEFEQQAARILNENADELEQQRKDFDEMRKKIFQ